jgi:hypothetical protein
MSKVIKITDTHAEIKIGNSIQEIPVEWVDGMPQFIESPTVGVRLGKSGSKIWVSKARLVKNSNYSALRGNSEYLIDAFSPLNSINRNFVAVQITHFWEDVPETQKSRR